RTPAWTSARCGSSAATAEVFRAAQPRFREVRRPRDARTPDLVVAWPGRTLRPGHGPLRRQDHATPRRENRHARAANPPFLTHGGTPSRRAGSVPGVTRLAPGA